MDLRNGNKVSLDQIAKKIIVEQHNDDQSRAHVYFYSKHPFRKKSTDKVSDLVGTIERNEIPALEVKGLGEHGLAFSTPSVHKNGFQYAFFEGGTTEPEIFDDLDRHIDSICRRYNIPYFDTNNDQSLQFIIYSNRKLKSMKDTIGTKHYSRVMESLIKRNSTILDLEQIRKYSHDWNMKHCVPPLENQEEERQWKDALRFIQKKDELEDDFLGNIKEKQFSTAETIVKLASKKIKVLFRDQYGTAFAQIRLLHLQ